MLLFTALILYLLISCSVLLFQAALLFGAPLGEYTMGGKWKGTLPASVRWTLPFQMLLIVFFAFVVSARTGLVLSEFQTFAAYAIWFPFGFFAVGTVLNWITPSKKERLIWGPVNTLAFFIVAAVATDLLKN